MRNPLYWADEALITRVAEPLAWRLQLRADKDNFWLARFANNISGAALVAANAGIAFMSPADAVIMLPLGLYVSWYIWNSAQQAICNAECEVKRSPTFLNLRKTGPIQPLRIFLFWFGFPIMGGALGGAGETVSSWLIGLGLFAGGQFVYAYFNSCNPLPPGWQPTRRVPNALPQGT